MGFHELATFCLCKIALLGLLMILYDVGKLCCVFWSSCCVGNFLRTNCKCGSCSEAATKERE